MKRREIENQPYIPGRYVHITESQRDIEQKPKLINQNKTKATQVERLKKIITTLRV